MGDIAYETMEDYRARIRELEEENNNLKNELMEDMKYETELEEKIRFLEQCLDNKEKVNKSMRKDNKSLREEIRNLKKELGKITVHSNMLESENILLKKECKARLDKIEELENIIDTIMEKTCIDHITLASGEVFLNPSKRLKTSLEK